MSLESRFKLSMSAEALRRKYADEREKRLNLRPQGNAQYREMTGGLAEYDRDIHADKALSREPIAAEHEVLVVGGGFGGMLQAAHLRKQGIDDFLIVEAGSDFGGTWYWNRYPGAACDVESYIYLPLLDETGYVPTEKYAKAPEIHAYCQQLARHFRMYDAALFQTRVTGAKWDAAASRWVVSTDHGDRISVRYLVIAGGILHKAKLPGIDGIESFEGHAFHTSRWDYGYTGGGPGAFMDRLGDKKVGIIGTGATAVQAIPHLAEAAGHLYVFQRTPSSIGIRGNKPTDPEWAASLKPGWAEERIANFRAVMSGRKNVPDMVEDGWTAISLRDGSDRVDSQADLEAAAELADFERMEEIRARIDAVVKDRRTAEALKPWYGHMCKRPCFHDSYLEVFNRPNVTLVDTQGEGVNQLSARGVVVAGKEYPLDLLIFASGFETTTEFTRRMGFDPVGPEGRPLSRVWQEDGPETLYGVSVRGFPNMMVISTVQGGGAGINFVANIQEAAIQIAHIIRWATDKGAATVEPTREAAAAWLSTVLGSTMQMAAYNAKCTPGYWNNEGERDPSAAKRAAYVGKVDEYHELMAEWRDSGGPDRDLVITRAD